MFVLNLLLVRMNNLLESCDREELVRHMALISLNLQTIEMLRVKPCNII